MAKSPKKAKKQNLKRKTTKQLARELFPREVLDEMSVQLKDAESKRDD